MLRSLRHVVPGEPNHAPARGAHDLVPATIATECPARAMGAKAVCLHDQAMSVPDEVDLHLLAGHRDPLVHCRPRQPLSAAEGQEPSLEVTARHVHPDISGADHLSKPADPAPPTGTRQNIVQRGPIEYAETLGLVASPLEHRSRDHRGEVKQGAGDGGAGNTAHRGALGRSSRVGRWTAMPGREIPTRRLIVTGWSPRPSKEGCAGQRPRHARGRLQLRRPAAPPSTCPRRAGLCDRARRRPGALRGAFQSRLGGERPPG
jgi:hypothetical protein